MKLVLALGFSASLLIGVPESSSAQTGPGLIVRDSAAKNKEGPSDTWSAKPIGSYDLVLDTPERKIPSALTISERDGKLSALLWPEGDNDGHVMDVTVKGVDLVLTAIASHGPVTITIERRGRNLDGIWTMGGEGGSLKGSIKTPTGPS
jgi:hypothetical protein